MPKLILVTVGTSALEKCCDKNKYPDVEELAIQLNRKGETSQLYTEVKENVLKNLKTNTQRNVENRDTDYSKLSAELASLLAMGKNPGIGKIENDDRIVLLHSDTTDGKLCAEANAEVMRQEVKINDEVKKKIWHVEEPIKIEDLRVDDPENFYNGLQNLKTKVTSLVKGPQSNYFNITGGFKGVIPFITVLAWDLLFPKLFYLYEKSEQIVVLSRPNNWPTDSVFDKMKIYIPPRRGE